MSANTAKAQPWKAHWSPMTESMTGYSYMTDTSGTLLIDGASDCVNAVYFSELACARNESAAKAQPWKAHWSPMRNDTSNATVYMTDGSGSLLIDGVQNCTSADSFSELACARKEEKKE